MYIYAYRVPICMTYLYVLRFYMQFRFSVQFFMKELTIKYFYEYLQIIIYLVLLKIKLHLNFDLCY